MRRLFIVAALAGLLLGCAVPVARASTAAQGVTIALTPASQQVAPGSQFDVFLEVTQAGDPFNGFDAVVGYDPGALTLVPMDPIDLQQGALMTGACGNTFHVFKAHAGVDSITDVLLCSGVSVTGPGQIYHLRFQASDTPQLTQVRFLPGVQFYNAGLYVLPLASSDAVITIGSPVGVDVRGTAGLTLAAIPNPGIGNLVFTIGSGAEGTASLTVFDLQGRVVRRFETTRIAAGIQSIPWDGRGDGGMKVTAGIYLARLVVANRVVWTRVTMLR